MSMDQDKTLKTLEDRTVRFTRDQLVPASRVPCLNLLELEETAAYELPGNDEYLLIECKPRYPATRCPYCQRSTGKISKNGQRAYPRICHDVNIGLMQVDLCVAVQKYKCGACGNVFEQEFPDLVPGRQFTKRLLNQIKIESFYSVFSKVAVDFGISIPTVESIFDEYAKELEQKHAKKSVGTWLAIDEKHVVNKMRGVLVDGETGNLLEITENNSPETMKAAIRSIPGYEHITHVTTDMANSYKSVIEDVFGSSVTLIVDKWHVLNDLSVKIKRCRSAIIDYLDEQLKKETDEKTREYKKAVKKMVTDNGYLFKFGDEKLAEKPERMQMLAEVCKAFPEFNHLRLLKEGFELIYDCTNRTAAESVYEQWCELVPPSGKRQIALWEAQYGVPASLFEEMRVLRNNVSNRWRKEIFNYFNEGSFKTNAIAEATNAFIERFVINGYTFERLRAKALFWYDAAPRKRYVIETRKQLRSSEPVMMKMGSAFTGRDWFFSQDYIEEDVYGIYEKEVLDNRKKTDALSVFYFLTPERKSFYRSLGFFP